jgi:signal transduction histidine kinase
MKQTLPGLERQYVMALRRHLKREVARAMPPCGAALKLGRQAVALGLETLDLARIHAVALTTLKIPSHRNGLAKRAEAFFAEAITPIERTHRAALEAGVRLGRLNRELGRRTAALTNSNQSLQQGIVQRKTAQQAFKKSGDHSRTLLKESRRLQQHLQRLTRQILSAHEDKRKQVSRDLRDEIAQTLLGIHVRLLTLKKGAEVNAGSLKKEIASTQRLVDNSVRSIKRFACEFRIHHRM